MASLLPSAGKSSKFIPYLLSSTGHRVQRSFSVRSTQQRKEVLYDAIVVGLGGHGAASLAALSRTKGMKILGIEKEAEDVYDHGSSYGSSRVIRTAYFEDPRYVPLLQKSLQKWKSLQARHKTLDILKMTGGLMIGKPDSTIISGTLSSIKSHGLQHEYLDADTIRSRFKNVFDIDDDDIGLYEYDAGYLIPENCIYAYRIEAKENSAEIYYNEMLTSYTTNNDVDDTITVNTDKGNYRTKKLLLSVGAWAPSIYGESIPMDLHVERRVQFWFKPTNEENASLFHDIPIYIYDKGPNNFYGFPYQNGQDGVKVARHSVTNEPPVSPWNINRNVSSEEIQGMKDLLAQHVPTLNGELTRAATCMYTLSSDGHFLLDKHPQNENVILISACSGHGFKFCPIIGDIASDLAIEGKTNSDISLFKCRPR